MVENQKRLVKELPAVTTRRILETKKNISNLMNNTPYDNGGDFVYE